LGRSLALNDVVISRGSFSRLVYVNMKISGESVTSYAGDGLIISTPVGSTAHSLSAGGPILEPDLDAMVVTPIAAHTLSNRPLVVCANQVIELSVISRGQEVGLSVDGQVYFRIGDGDTVRVVRAKERFLIYELGAHRFYDKLRNRFGWGGILPYKV
jgi:NAD+ kinase